MIPRKNWPSIERNNNRYSRSRTMSLANLGQSNKFLFSPNDDYQKAFTLNERDSLAADQQHQQTSNILNEQNLDQHYEHRSIKNLQPNPNLNLNMNDKQVTSSQESNHQANDENDRHEQNDQLQSSTSSCSCKPIVKTKYVAIEIPKIVKVPSDSNSQSSNSEQSSILPPVSPQTQPSLSPSKPDSESLLNSNRQNDESVGKTRIITIRELPSGQPGSKTILVNTVEGKSNYQHHHSKNVNNLRPSKVRKPIPTSLPSMTTYYGYEEAF